MTELVERFDCTILYLSTYSPDFNPVEHLSRGLKAFVKKLSPLSLPELIGAFSDAAQSVTLKNIADSLERCGYLTRSCVGK